MNDYILVAILLLINALGWIFTLSKYKQLTSWLKDQAPMTWETYQRLGTGYKCNGDCRQGRDCPNRKK
jgi:hypothetical protein